MSEVENNLKAAFAGESQANRKYLAFAKKADEEGFKGIAKLFRAAAAAETIHAHNHLNVLNGVKSTKENLKEAFGGEHYEFTEMYPEFLKNAKEVKNAAAIKTFHWANEVEKVHGALYQAALDTLEGGGSYPDADFYVCPKCGHTASGEAPAKCPVCGAKKEEYFKVD